MNNKLRFNTSFVFCCVTTTFKMYRLLFYLTVTSLCMHSGSGALWDNRATFYYFAYGSNLLTARIHIQNPTAVYMDTAKLENHRLDFNLFSTAWNGAVATIVDDVGKEVWGTLWTIDLDQMGHLDEQEGVHTGWYFPKNVTVTTPDGTEILARTYEIVDTPEKVKEGEDLPPWRRPSSTYLAVIALGAVESRLPADYIGSIFTFPTNGLLASPSRREELGYPF